MAKKGNVKKGFANYLLILFIAIVAAFFILVTIMLFSPFKGILGFKYFVYSNEKVYLNIDGSNDSDVFDFNNITDINVDCGFASVYIIRSHDVDYSGVKIENKTSGFAREDQDTDFFAELSYSNDTKTALNISVKEPEGFLYFNKNISIKILVSDRRDYSLENAKITVTNTNGDVYIGNNNRQATVDEQPQRGLLKINNLNIRTTTGSINMFQNVDSVNEFEAKTTRGNINTHNNLNVNNFKVYSKSGKISFNNIIAKGVAIFDLENAEFSAENIVIQTSGEARLSIKDGYFDVNKITGNLNSYHMIGDMGSAKLNINEIDGNVSLPNLNKTSLNISTITDGSQVHLRGYSSPISINELRGKAWIETTSGKVDVHTYNKFISIITGSGNINLDYDCEQTDGIEISSSSGAVNLGVRYTIPFVLEVYGSDGKMRTSKNINIQSFDRDFTLPFTFNEGTEVIKINANKKVSISFIEEA